MSEKSRLRPVPPEGIAIIKAVRTDFYHSLPHKDDCKNSSLTHIWLAFSEQMKKILLANQKWQIARTAQRMLAKLHFFSSTIQA